MGEIFWLELITRQEPEEAVRITPTAMMAPAQLSFSTCTVPDPSPENSQGADLLTSTNPIKILPISKPLSQVMLHLT